MVAPGIVDNFSVEKNWEVCIILTQKQSGKMDGIKGIFIVP